MADFKVGDTVWHDDNRLTVLDGPYRTLEYPDHDQYTCGVPGSLYQKKPYWASDLLTHAEWMEAHRGE